MKDTEPLPGRKGDKEERSSAPDAKESFYVISPIDGQRSLRKWCLISREFDDLPVTHPDHAFFKVARSIMAHISRRESEERGCDAGLRDMARHVCSHIDHVKHVLKYLVSVGIVTRVKRPGQTSVLRLANKMKWLEANPPYSGKRQKPAPPEESREEADRQIRNVLWARIWQIPGGTGAPQKPFEKMMERDLAVFDATLAEMENRVKRGLPGNKAVYGPDALVAVKNFVGLFIDTFGRFLKANGK